MNFDSKNTQITGNYAEFHSESNIPAAPINQRRINNRQPIKLSFSEYYGNRCCFFLSILFIASFVLFFGGMTLLILPITNKTYLNNIRLEKTFSTWNHHNYSSEFSKYSIALKVISMALTINLKHLSHDPKYAKQKYYKPSLFYLNVTNSSDSSEIKKLLQKTGSLNLKSAKVPPGVSSSFCLSFLETRSTNQSTLISNYSNILKLPFCGKQKYRGVKILPYKRVKFTNITEETCEKNDGLYFNEICYKYLILNQICIEVKRNATDNSIYYKQGCFRTINNTKFFKYKKASISKNYNFIEFSIFVRHSKDPYLTLMNFFHEDNITSIRISTGFLEKIIPTSIFLGVSTFAVFIMFYILLKGRVHHKFKLL